MNRPLWHTHAPSIFCLTRFLGQAVWVRFTPLHLSQSEGGGARASKGAYTFHRSQMGLCDL